MITIHNAILSTPCQAAPPCQRSIGSGGVGQFTIAHAQG